MESVGCKICRCSRSPLVSKMCGFGTIGYLFGEDKKALILSISIFTDSHSMFVCVCIQVRMGVNECECEATSLLN